MSPEIFSKYREIWAVDFEFGATPGNNPGVRCLVAKELKSGRLVRLWASDLEGLASPPYDIAKDSLFIAFYSSAEFSCHLALNWPLPQNVLDLFVEFRNLTNGYSTPSGNSLIGALTYFGVPHIEAAEKDEMRDLALRGGDYSSEEKAALLDYCQTDVDALHVLFHKMLPALDLPRALLRGQYMKSVARMEFTGIPIDVEMFSLIGRHWQKIQHDLIDKVDSAYGVYENHSFKADKFAAYLLTQAIPWPRLPTGKLNLQDQTFKDMAQIYPALRPLKELRQTLSQMKMWELSVGHDGRNRCLLSPFRAKTSRNQPSNTRFIFGLSSWARSLIKPGPGKFLAYVDYSQQEFGVAAALSGDANMAHAYLSGDPYLAFARQAGAVPPEATKQSHGDIRDQFKACVLAVQYGMGAESLALRMGQPAYRAAELLELHRRTYPKFWKWSDAVVDVAVLSGSLHTVFGWNSKTPDIINARALRNFPMQANGAEILRLACCFIHEQGIKICAPVHDALLIEGDIGHRDEIIKETQRLMAKAAAVVLGGFELRTEVEIIEYPARYMNKKGETMWNTVVELAIAAEESAT